mgnify:CR=1 FL=1
MKSNNNKKSTFTIEDFEKGLLLAGYITPHTENELIELYLCEHAGNMNLQSRYEKFAAGPFDNNFMHSINQEFEKQKWFNIVIDKSNGYNKPVYSASSNIEKYKDYYSKYFLDQNEAIQKIIELFRKTKTREVELVATIYFCLLEIKQNC